MYFYRFFYKKIYIIPLLVYIMADYKICPNCGSKNIVSDMSSPDKVVTGLFTQFYKCEDCDHKGSFFPLVDELSEQDVKHVKPAEFDEINPNSLFFANLYKLLTPIVFLVAIYQIFFSDYCF